MPNPLITLAGDPLTVALGRHLLVTDAANRDPEQSYGWDARLEAQTAAWLALNDSAGTARDAWSAFGSQTAEPEPVYTVPTLAEWERHLAALVVDVLSKPEEGMVNTEPEDDSDGWAALAGMVGVDTLRHRTVKFTRAWADSAGGLDVTEHEAQRRHGPVTRRIVTVLDNGTVEIVSERWQRKGSGTRGAWRQRRYARPRQSDSVESLAERMATAWRAVGR